MCSQRVVGLSENLQQSCVEKFLVSVEMTARNSVPYSGCYPDQSSLFKAPTVVALVMQEKLIVWRKSSSALDRLSNKYLQIEGHNWDLQGEGSPY